MGHFTKDQYEYALERIEDLLPVVDENNSKDPKTIELSVLSDVVIDYEKENFPIEKPTVAELIADGLIEKSMTQKQLSEAIGVSPSRINDFVSGKSEPSLRLARLLCQTLGIKPAAMLGI